MRPGRLLLAIVGATLGLVALGLIMAGAALLWAQTFERDADGYFTSETVELATTTHALVSTDFQLGAGPQDWFPSGGLATLRLHVDPAGAAPTFVGIGPEASVDAYLSGAGYAEVTEIEDDGADYAVTSGTAPAPPGDQAFWVASVSGAGPGDLTWEPRSGRWTVVIMNADASAGVEVSAAAGVASDLVVPVAAGLLAVGILLAAGAAALLVTAVRRPPGADLPGIPVVSGTYPLVLDASPSPEAGRWLWLVKWLLLVPHLVALAFLFTAYAILTVAAFFAILFTGSYPRSIFDFNVGVMRWAWRVSYYSYGVLGTDAYPPFTLSEVPDYPAHLQVEYPPRLSRGLALVKWWLLAIPHYLIVGVLTSGLVWWTSELGESESAVLRSGGGLIGLLVLVAGVLLIVTGRYPPALYDLIVGLNRWVYRVWAYAGLMTDDYPPFRLDTGGPEPAPPDRPVDPD